MAGVSLADVGRLDLRDLESPEPDESANLEHHVVPIRDGGSTELVKILVGHPDFVRVFALRCLKSHVDYYIFRRKVYRI